METMTAVTIKKNLQSKRKKKGTLHCKQKLLHLIQRRLRRSTDCSTRSHRCCHSPIGSPTHNRNRCQMTRSTDPSRQSHHYLHSHIAVPSCSRNLVLALVLVL